MSNSVAELVANCFNVSGVGGENPEKWKAVMAVSALEAKLEAMKAAALQLEDDLDGTAFLDYDKNDAHDLESAGVLFRLAAAQQEEKE